jgi:hypothetical protein
MRRGHHQLGQALLPSALHQQLVIGLAGKGRCLFLILLRRLGRVNEEKTLLEQLRQKS